ncbi:uncharacterized protein LOC125377413 [Haliotis rufescens]|uniref:uncharacterized protein LOC125377413 n=1 Tax=Haliotis rufescens TaxID=6454 RepID=UPI00201FAE2D|nr:uncharacterized protein LOC125377413 [Haliotis rufescens]
MADTCKENNFILVIWIKDHPVTGNVVSIRNIVSPRRPYYEYAVGQTVDARCPGLGTFQGMIGAIGDSKKNLQQLLAEDKFPQLVQRIVNDIPPAHPKINTGSSEENQSDLQERDEIQLEVAGNNDYPVQPVPKKRKIDVQEKQKDKEAQEAKKDQAKKKKKATDARDSGNRLQSLAVIGPGLPDSVEQLHEKLNKMDDKMSQLLFLRQQDQEMLRDMQAQIDNFKSCRACVKGVYRNLKDNGSGKPCSLQSPEARKSLLLASPTSLPSLPSPPPPPQPPKPQPSSSSWVSQGQPQVLEDISDLAEDIISTVEPVSDIPPLSERNQAFLGDPRHGIKVSAERLRACEEASTNPVKLALSLLPLLITKEDCKTLSVKGEAPGKRAMDENVRRALRSHIFQKFSVSAMKMEEMWAEISKKLNDKIRAVKNGKCRLE